MAVEIGAAHLAVKYATEKDIQELEEIVKLMGELAKQNMHANFNEIDMRFHETMVKSAHSPHLLDMYHRANFPLTASPKRAGVVKLDAKKHEKILQALKKRNFPTLSRLLAQGYEH